MRDCFLYRYRCRSWGWYHCRCLGPVGPWRLVGCYRYRCRFARYRGRNLGRLSCQRIGRCLCPRLMERVVRHLERRSEGSCFEWASWVCKVSLVWFLELRFAGFLGLRLDRLLGPLPGLNLVRSLDQNLDPHLGLNLGCHRWFLFLSRSNWTKLAHSKRWGMMQCPWDKQL